MQRRDFIKSAAAAGIIGTVGRRAHTAETGWRRFEITYRINIKDSDSDTDVRLWVPVPQDALDYQRVLDLALAFAGRRSCRVGGGFAGTDRLGHLDGREDSARDRDHRPGGNPRPIRFLP